MIKYLMIPVVVFTAAGAQVLMKYTINLALADKIDLISIFKAWHIYVSICLYITAFIATIYLFSEFELSFISPLLVGGVMLLIFVSGLVMGEAITPIRVAGGLLLVSGTVLLTYSQ